MIVTCAYRLEPTGVVHQPRLSALLLKDIFWIFGIAEKLLVLDDGVIQCQW